MTERLIWSIGSPDGVSGQLEDTFKQPTRLGGVFWNADAPKPGARWPMYHPSEADPEAGYRPHPYTIAFKLDQEPAAAYKLHVAFLVIAPRVASLEVRANGVPGFAYLRPEPSQSGEIRLLSGLHTTIYADGSLDVVIPGRLLRRGENRLVLISRDGRETIRVEREEAVKRLDRMANGAGFLYQHVSLAEIGGESAGPSVALADVLPTVLYRRNERGELTESCWLHLELGRGIPASELTLELREAGRTETIRLPVPETAFGHVCLPFELFDGEGPVAWTLSGRIGGAPFVRAGELVRRRKWKVFVTPHAHTDIGYTHRQWEVAERLCRNIDTAIDLLEQGGDSFAYHLDASWALETYAATRSEERVRQLRKWIAAGKIGIASQYADVLTQYAGLEDLIRNGMFTDDFLGRMGRRAEFAAIVDVASMTGSLPAILEGSGVKYLVHANNQDRGPFRLNGGLNRKSPFYWEGVNGGKVLTWLAKMYCELRKVCGSPPMPAAAERGLDLWLREYESGDYAPDAVLLYGQEADNTDLDPQPVAFVAEWNATYAYPQLIPCDVGAFFRYVEEGFAASLHTVKGDGGAYWEDGIGSSIVPTIAVREAQAALPAAEKLESLAVLHGPGWRYPAEHFAEAWKQVLLYDEHTWGAFLSCTDPEALLARDQWAVKERMATEAGQWAQRLLHGAAVRHSLSWNNDGREIVVYNPHSWPVSGTVLAETAIGEAAVDPRTGEAVPGRIVKTLRTQAWLELWIDRLEGLGYRRLRLVPATGGATEGRDGGADPKRGQGVSTQRMEPSEPAGKPGAPDVRVSPLGEDGTVTLTSSDYRLTVDVNRGAAVSWFDLALNRELIDPDGLYGFGQLLYAQGGEGTRLVSNQSDLPDGNPEVSASFERTACEVDAYGYGARLKLRGRVPCGELETVWTLYRDEKRVDVEYRYRKEERLSKEAVYVAFPAALSEAKVASDSQLGWVDWDGDQLPGGCKEWLPLQTGIRLSGRQADVLVASPDIPLFTVNDIVRGRWPKEMKLRGGTVFSYVLNNYWHTNYKASQGGEIRFRYRLTSGASIAPDDAYRFGWEARRPLYAHRISFQDFRAVRPPYERNDGGKLAAVDADSVVLTTMKQAERSGGWVVRLQEIAGNEQTAAVAFPGVRIAEAWETDLLENDVRPHPVQPDGSLRVRVPAWGLATVKLRTEGG